MNNGQKTAISLSPSSLEKLLSSYHSFIKIIAAFIFLTFALFVFNPKGFNKAFGEQIFITGPILLIIAIFLKELFAFDNNQSSLFSSIPIDKQLLKAIIIISILSLAIFGWFMMLYIGGIFSDKPPENNSAMILNFVLFFLFFAIAAFIFNKSKDKDNVILNTLPKPIQEAFKERTKYTGIFIAFCMIIALLYFVNPWGIMTNYGGPVIFFTLFIGIVMVTMITSYQTYLADPITNNLNDIPKPTPIIFKGLYILAALGISAGLIYGMLKLLGVFEQDANKPESVGHFIFNLLMFCAMLGIIYKLANAGGFLDKNPYYRLILNTLLYIPCLLVNFIQIITNLFSGNKTKTESTKTSAFEIKMLILSLGLLGFYFLWTFFLHKYLQSKYLKQGGNQLINQPITTDKLTNVASYQTLTDKDHPDYQYAISFWFYLDSFPPSTNASYNKIVSLLSYGDNPAVKYSSANNTLFITVKQKNKEDDTNEEKEVTTSKNRNMNKESILKWKQNKQNKQEKEDNIIDSLKENIEQVKRMTFANETDAEGNRILYRHPDVQLQKWNHVLLNYRGGTLDVFYNGELVKSAIEVVPYIKLDMLTVGTENGVSGNIANLMYFKYPLDVLTIHTLYASLRNKSPPTIESISASLIPK
jgi:hypothetical protein